MRNKSISDAVDSMSIADENMTILHLFNIETLFESTFRLYDNETYRWMIKIQYGENSSLITEARRFAKIA